MLDHLEIDQAIILGHSLGGAFAAAFAARWPQRTRALALLASLSLVPNRGFRRTPIKFAARMVRIPLVRRPFLRMARRAFVEAGFSRNLRDDEARAAILTSAATRFDEHTRNVQSLTMPTLVAWTQDDPMLATEESRGLANAAPPGPRFEYATGGHNLQKTWATELGQAITEWMP